MAEKTGISWTDSTWNPWIGCTRVSPGCDHCYAAVSTPARALRVTWGAHEQRRRTSEANWQLPRRWNDAHAAFAAANGRRRRVFCASLADVFDDEVDPTWRADVWALIRETPHLFWLLLTKRIGNARRMLPVDWGEGYHNVGLGATVVHQEEADRDIWRLLRTRARMRFLSIEPMLSSMDISRWLGPQCDAGSVEVPGGGGVMCEICGGTRVRGGCRALHWVIAGGESGPHARSSHPDWFRSLRDQCSAAEVPFFFKQVGGRDKAKGGDLLDGAEIKAWP